MTMKVTPNELAQWLDRYQGGCRICSVTMLTPLKMNQKSRITKQPNPYLFDGESTIDHLSERLVFCGADYEKMVQRAWEANLQANADGYIPAFQAAALWNGKGIHLNRYIAQHVEKQTLYLCLLYARVKGENMEWVENSLKQEAWLDRITGLEIQPDWSDLAQYLPPGSEPSKKQGCREGADMEMDIDGKPYLLKGGDNSKEVCVRMPHLENVLQIRSFDLKQRGKFEVIELKRGKYQVSV
jgi:hypothetical protein